MTDVDKYIIQAFNEMIKKDKNLKDAHECSYAHRFAIYLEKLLKKDEKYKEYDVDIEYNRNGETAKKICWKESNDDSLIRPDVIVHKRGEKDNLIVIELKKENIPEYDKNKVSSMCKCDEYEYKNGYCISINKKQIIKYNKPKYMWVSLIGEENE